jgi:hypothetical protein
VAGFAAATTPRASSDVEGGYDVVLDGQWTVGGRPNGGYLLAVMARAALDSAVRVGAELDRAALPHPLSASAIYLASPEQGPATVFVELLRHGRSSDQLRARLEQGGQVCVEALFTTGRLDSSAEVSWVDEPAPELTPFDECARSPLEPPGSGLHISLLEAIDQRLDPKAFGNPPGELRGWVRFADGEAFDPVGLLFAVDCMPPATFTLGFAGWTPTLELTAYIRAVPQPGPLRVRQRARLVSGNLTDQLCDVWDATGRLVAQATQLASLRRAVR